MSKQQKTRISTQTYTAICQNRAGVFNRILSGILPLIPISSPRKQLLKGPHVFNQGKQTKYRFRILKATLEIIAVFSFPEAMPTDKLFCHITAVGLPIR